MSRSPHIQSHYHSSRYPNSAGSIVEYLEGLTEHESHPQLNTSFNKSRLSDSGSISYYSPGLVYGLDAPRVQFDLYPRTIAYSLTMTNSRNMQISPELEGVWIPHSEIVQVFSDDAINPDTMTYEELLELGDTIGYQSRGLSQDLISQLPVSKYRCGFFSRMKLRKKRERCVICQMEYKRKDRQITLPCKHVYHLDCGSKWLSINKACPICSTEVFGDASKH